MAQSSPFSVPLWIAPKAPWPTFSLRIRSFGSTSHSATEACWMSSLAFHRFRKDDPRRIPLPAGWAPAWPSPSDPPAPPSVRRGPPPSPAPRERGWSPPPALPEGAACACSPPGVPLRSRENLAWSKLSKAVRCSDVTLPLSSSTNQYR